MLDYPYRVHGLDNMRIVMRVRVSKASPERRCKARGDVSVASANRLVDLLDGRPVVRCLRAGETARSTAGETARCASREALGCAARCRVQLLHDRVGNRLELLLAGLVLLLRGFRGDVEPLDGLVDGVVELLLVCRVEFVGELLVGERVAQVVGVRLEAVLRLDARSCLLVLLCKSKLVKSLERKLRNRTHSCTSPPRTPCGQCPPWTDGPYRW